MLFFLNPSKKNFYPSLPKQIVIFGEVTCSFGDGIFLSEKEFLKIVPYFVLRLGPDYSTQINPPRPMRVTSMFIPKNQEYVSYIPSGYLFLHGGWLLARNSFASFTDEDKSGEHLIPVAYTVTFPRGFIKF